MTHQVKVGYSLTSVAYHDKEVIISNHLGQNQENITFLHDTVKLTFSNRWSDYDKPYIQ